jgi:hypothetical protein
MDLEGENALGTGVARSARQGSSRTNAETRTEEGARTLTDPRATFAHMARLFDAVRTRKPVIEDGRRGHHAAAVAPMVNESVRRRSPVSWDFDAGPLTAP